MPPLWSYDHWSGTKFRLTKKKLTMTLPASAFALNVVMRPLVRNKIPAYGELFDEWDAEDVDDDEESDDSDETEEE